MQHLPRLIAALALATLATLATLTPALAQLGPAPVTPQNPCGVADPNVPLYYKDISSYPAEAGQRLKCAPEPAGPGKGLQVRVKAGGVVAWYYCPDKTPNPTSWGHVMVAGLWPRILAADFKIDTPMSDPTLTPLWCPHIAEMVANAPKIAPPAGAWVTASAITYSSSGGSLKGYAGMAAKGLACDCTAPLKVGSATYCTFVGAASANIVAQCTRP